MALPLGFWKPTTLSAGRGTFARVADARRIQQKLRVELVGVSGATRCLYVWDPNPTLEKTLSVGNAVELIGFGVRVSRAADDPTIPYILVANKDTAARTLSEHEAREAGLPDRAEHAKRRTLEGVLRRVVRCTERSAEWHLEVAQKKGLLRLVIPRPTARILNGGRAGAQVAAARAGLGSNGRCWFADADSIQFVGNDEFPAPEQLAGCPDARALLRSPAACVALASRCGGDGVTVDFEGVAKHCPAAEPRAGRCEWLLVGNGPAPRQAPLRVLVFPGCDAFGLSFLRGARVLMRGLRVVNGRSPTAFAGKGCSATACPPSYTSA